MQPFRSNRPQIYVFSCANPPMRSVVVVDGSNVIHANIGSKRFFDVKRVENVIAKLEEKGYTYHIGMKHGTYKYAMHTATEDEISDADKATLKDLAESLHIHMLNADRDDRWLHLAAIEFDAYILSNDQFRNELDQWREEGREDIATEVEKRRVALEFFGDKPIFDLPDVHVEPEPSIGLEHESLRLDDTIKESIPIETHFGHESTDGLGAEHRESVHALVKMGDGGLWREVSIPFETPIGRAFFAEVFGDSEAFISALKKISREHFILQPTHGHSDSHDLRIVDTDSTNGTQAGGARVGSAGLAFSTGSPFGRRHPTWTSVMLGSRLVELRVNATLADVDHPCFDTCTCEFLTD